MFPAKLLEVRDRATTIPVLAFLISYPDRTTRESRYGSRVGVGIGQRICVVVRLSDNVATYDPNGWRDLRTMRTAHAFILANFETLVEFQVVDVEFILGEIGAPHPTDLP